MTAVDHQTGEVLCPACGVWLKTLVNNERYDITTWAHTVFGCRSERIDKMPFFDRIDLLDGILADANG